MGTTRRRLLAAAGAAGFGSLAGCTGGSGDTGGSGEPTAQASFFVFGDVAAQVAGDAAAADLLVPVGQHGHGWEPGPRVREDIRDADLLVHGMEGFQPWVDDVRTDLAADDADVRTVDVSADLDLLSADGESRDGGDGDVDPHFWMDPVRLKRAADAVREALGDVDPDGADAYAANAEAFGDRLDGVDDRIESTVADAARDVLLVAGHNSYGYFADRYGVEVQAVTGLSPDDRPTTRDIERAQSVVADHGLSYVCADPLESQTAAEQLVAETDAEAVLPLTAMPGLTEDWEAEDWGYVEVMQNVNLPTLERALEV